MEYDEPVFIHPKQVIDSSVIEGFVIPVRAIFDQKTNMDVLAGMMP